MIKIGIKRNFREDHITRNAGEKLRMMILEADDKHNKIEIDFSNTVIASTSFFDEGFAKLVECGWTKKKFDSQIILKNINKRDHEILTEMCRNRKMK